MEAVDEQIAELKARIKELEEIKLRLEIPFVEAMGQATVGMIPARENDSYYEVAYKARKQTVISAKNLMEKHPELMSEYTKVKDVYKRQIEGYKRCDSNRFWKEKIRQTLQPVSYTHLKKRLRKILMD